MLLSLYFSVATLPFLLSCWDKRISCIAWVISSIGRCLCKRGPVLTRNALKLAKTGFPSQIWKHSWIFMGSSGGTSLGLLVWEAARPATALSLCCPTHFRQRSVILETVKAMSAAPPLMLSSVAVIYTKWCLPALDAMQTAHLQFRTWKCNWRIH